MAITRNDPNPIERLLRIQALTTARLHDGSIYEDMDSARILEELKTIKIFLNGDAARPPIVPDTLINLCEDDRVKKFAKNKELQKALFGKEDNLDVFLDPQLQLAAIRRKLDEYIVALELMHQDLEKAKADSEKYSRVSGDKGLVFGLSFDVNNPTVSISAFNSARVQIQNWFANDPAQQRRAAAGGAPLHAGHVGTLQTREQLRSYQAKLSGDTTRDVSDSQTARVCASTIVSVSGTQIVGHVEYRENNITRFKTVMLPKELDPLKYLMGRMSPHINWPQDIRASAMDPDEKKQFDADVKKLVEDKIREKYGNRLNRVFTEEDYKGFLTILSRDQDLAQDITKTLEDGGAILRQKMSFSFIKTRGPKLAQLAAGDQQEHVKNPDNYIYLFRQLEGLHARGEIIHLQNFTSPDEVKMAVYFCQMNGFDYANHNKHLYNDQKEFKVTSQAQLDALQDKLIILYKFASPGISDPAKLNALADKFSPILNFIPGSPVTFNQLHALFRTLAGDHSGLPLSFKKDIKELEAEFKKYQEFSADFEDFKKAFEPGKFLAGEVLRQQERQIARAWIDEERKQRDSLLTSVAGASVMHAHDELVKKILDKIIAEQTPPAEAQPDLPEERKKKIMQSIAAQFGPALNAPDAETALKDAVKNKWMEEVRESKVEEIININMFNNTLQLEEQEVARRQELVHKLQALITDDLMQQGFQEKLDICHLFLTDANALTAREAIRQHICDNWADYKREVKAGEILDAIQKGKPESQQLSPEKRRELISLMVQDFGARLDAANVFQNSFIRDFFVKKLQEALHPRPAIRP